MTPAHLQITPQDGPHGDVTIVGTPAGLLALAQALSEALFQMPRTRQTFYPADGNGYEVHVRLVLDEATFARHLPTYTMPLDVERGP